MEINFKDFTTRREVHNYLVSKSRKKIVKIESRIMDDNGVVSEHFSDFTENCGDIKYYFEDDESLEINSLNRVALFVRANGEKLLVENALENENEVINLINGELGLDFRLLRKILISCALPVEFNAARNELGLKESSNKGDKFRIASSGYITLISTGPGKLNTVMGLNMIIKEFRPDIIIDSGTSGALNHDLNYEDIVVAVKALDFYNISNRGTTFENKNIKKLTKMLSYIKLSNYVIASVEKSITSEEDREMLTVAECDIVNWESSAVFSVAESNNIPYISVRGITDMCNTETFSDFKKNSAKVCKKVYNYIKIVCKGV